MDKKQLRDLLVKAIGLIDLEEPTATQPPDTVVVVPEKAETQVTPTKDPYVYFRPLFDLFGKSEGTDQGRGYNETLGYGAYTGGPKDLVNMTLDQIDTLQRQMLKHPDNHLNSSALGRYQIVGKTLRSLREELNLSGNLKYDQALQDDLCAQLLVRRKIGSWLLNRLSTENFMIGLAQEWASIPTPLGKSYYGGKARVTVTEVQAALGKVRELWKAASNPQKL